MIFSELLLPFYFQVLLRPKNKYRYNFVFYDKGFWVFIILTNIACISFTIITIASFWLSGGSKLDYQIKAHYSLTAKCEYCEYYKCYMNLMQNEWFQQQKLGADA